MPLPQSKPRQALLVPRLAVKPALEQRQSDLFILLGHDEPQAMISATVLPRLAAISSGERIRVSASSVARTTLIGFREP